MQPITSTASESGTLVRVAVRLDAEGCEPLAQEFDRLLRAGEHRVALDLTDVAFMSSAGSPRSAVGWRSWPPASRSGPSCG
jgi:anti-anti-sigma regulatory factor